MVSTLESGDKSRSNVSVQVLGIVQFHYHRSAFEGGRLGRIQEIKLAAFTIANKQVFGLKKLLQSLPGALPLDENTLLDVVQNGHFLAILLRLRIDIEGVDPRRWKAQCEANGVITLVAANIHHGHRAA